MPAASAGASLTREVLREPRPAPVSERT